MIATLFPPISQRSLQETQRQRRCWSGSGANFSPTFMQWQTTARSPWTRTSVKALWPASPDELAEIADFLRTHGGHRQFFPVWTQEALCNLAALGLRTEDLRIARRGAKIVGVTGLWDQAAYKQTVVRSYSGWLKAVVPFWNSSAAWFGRSALPRPGEKLRSAYASLICVAEDDAAVFGSLLREVYNLARLRGFSYLLVGLDARDPLLPVARAYTHVLYRSTLYLAEWSEGGQLHEQLDQRPVYVDAATL